MTSRVVNYNVHNFISTYVGTHICTCFICTSIFGKCKLYFTCMYTNVLFAESWLAQKRESLFGIF